jgi:steroid delta-isomerase-like uncharacterized protein
MIDQIQKHLKALSDGDWDEYREGLAENVVYEEVPTKQRLEGIEKFVASVRRWKKAFPDLSGKVLDYVISGDKAMVEVEWTGIHQGELEAPFGILPPTNRQARTRAVLSLTFVDGKIAESRHYFDLFTLMGQLGLAPTLVKAPSVTRPQQAPTRPHRG